MKSDIEFISKETIKPSSPTPPHLQTHHLSLLDQTSPPHYNGVIFFFESKSNSSKNEISNILKSSLSESLSRFYPLAGRLVNNESINCNDEGTPYTEAYARSHLSEVIHDKNNGQHEKFLPREAVDFDDNVVLAIQVNLFDCGGIAIGACFSHKLADAFSIFMFINSWAATCRGQNKINAPIFDLAKVFPPSDKLKFLPSRPELENKKEVIVTKMFTLNSTILETLRTKFSDQEGDPLRATRVEALSAFIWSRYMTVISNANTSLEKLCCMNRAESSRSRASLNSSPEKLYCMNTAVSLRNRASLDSSSEDINLSSESHFGNFYTLAVAMPSMDDKGSDLVRRMRAATKNIDGEFVKMLGKGDEYLNFLFAMFEKAAKREMVSFSFSSWSKMGAYEADFGWGKPTRVGLGEMPLKNFARFMDMKNGDGIEAWISMEEDDMNKLEADKEFNSFVN